LSTTEQQRILQFQQGNPAVFESLFKDHYGPLCGFAGKFVEDSQVAEELVQELFVQLWEKKETFTFSGTFKSYLYASIRNSALNHLKHLKVRKGYQNYMEARETQPTASDPLDLAELESHIQNAVKALPDRCREVFLYSRKEGLKYAEIAERMGISVKTVEAQMGKALKMLRERLREYLPGIAILITLINIQDFL